MPKCSFCGKNVKDPSKITTCTSCGKLLCISCVGKHKC